MMKALTIAAVIAALPFVSLAEDAKPEPKIEVPAAAKQIEKLETKERYVFTGVEVLEKLPDGIYIKLKTVTTPQSKKKSPKDEGKLVEGGTWINDGATTFLPYESLTLDLQKKLGGFDPLKARDARKQREADREAGKGSRFLAPGDADELFAPYDAKGQRK